MKDKEHRERLRGTQIEEGEYKEITEACRHLAPKASNLPFNNTKKCDNWGDTMYIYICVCTHIEYVDVCTHRHVRACVRVCVCVCVCLRVCLCMLGSSIVRAKMECN